jgi:hypothetical protein
LMHLPLPPASAQTQTLRAGGLGKLPSPYILQSTAGSWQPTAVSEISLTCLSRPLQESLDDHTWWWLCSTSKVGIAGVGCLRPRVLHWLAGGRARVWIPAPPEKNFGLFLLPPGLQGLVPALIENQDRDQGDCIHTRESHSGGKTRVQIPLWCECISSLFFHLDSTGSPLRCWKIRTKNRAIVLWSYIGK